MLERIRQLIELIEPMRARETLQGAEIGVYEAHVSDGLLRAFANLHMFLVDPWVPFAGGDWISDQSPEYFAEVKANAINRIAHALGRYTIIERGSPAAAECVPHGELDFVFIDANHQYAAIRADIAAWWPTIRPGGLLTGHDYVAADNPFGLRGRGVKQAVIEFSHQTDTAYEVGGDSVWWMVKKA
jgi:hypothetical protein